MVKAGPGSGMTVKILATNAGYARNEQEAEGVGECPAGIGQELRGGPLRLGGSAPYSHQEVDGAGKEAGAKQELAPEHEHNSRECKPRSVTLRTGHRVYVYDIDSIVPQLPMRV